MHIRVLAATAAAIALAAPAAQAATFMPTTVEATCLAGCLDQTHSYKQTIEASSFSGPVSIGGFSFDRNLLGADHQTAVFHVTFWTADGQEVGDFGHYMVGSLAGQVLNLKGESFAYDPSLGNLIMKIELDGYGSGGAGGGGFGGFGGFGANPGALGGSASGTAGLDGGSVVEQISIQQPTAPVTGPLLVVGAPEPASWALMLLGFGGAGALLRRRRLRTA